MMETRCEHEEGLTIQAMGDQSLKTESTALLMETCRLTLVMFSLSLR